jgi:hypothetical protein
MSWILKLAEMIADRSFAIDISLVARNTHRPRWWAQTTGFSPK